MNKLSIRPGVGIYTIDNELHIELYPTGERIECTTDEQALATLSLLNGQYSMLEVYTKVHEKYPDYSREQFESLIDVLKKLEVIYEIEPLNRDLKKFSRVIDYFNMYPYQHDSNVNFFLGLRELTVLVVGCGGLGSSVIENLARTGIRKFMIVDDDTISLENLSNQSIFLSKDRGLPKIKIIEQFLKKLDPDIQVECHNLKVTSKNIDYFVERSQFVFSCADSPSVKEVSKFVSESCMKFDIPHIVGGGYSGHRGAIGTLVVPRETLCWNCYLKGEVQGDLHLKNEIISPSNKMSFYPLINMIASIQVNEFINFLKGEKLGISNCFNEFNLNRLEIKKEKITMQDDCYYCGEQEDKRYE